MLASLFLLATSPVYAPIFVGRFDTADFPNAARVERRMPQAELNNRVEKILGDECKLPGQTKIRYNITVPFAVLLDEAGKAKKVVVKDISCPPLETLVGQVGSELAREGDFKVAHSEGTRWYVSEVYFTRVSEEMARRDPNLDKIVCRETRPKINSRVAMVKVCRTGAEWALYDKDRDQYRRDFMSQDPKQVEGSGTPCGFAGRGCHRSEERRDTSIGLG